MILKFSGSFCREFLESESNIDEIIGLCYGLLVKRDSQSTIFRTRSMTNKILFKQFAKKLEIQKLIRFNSIILGLFWSSWLFIAIQR